MTSTDADRPGGPWVAEEVRGLAAAYGRGSRAYAAVLDPTLGQMAHDSVEIAGVRAGCRVLDLACGTGAIARAAADAGARVVAVDLSLGMTVTARSLSPASLACLVADATALPFRPHLFDVVTCGLTLSHFTEMRAVCREVRRMLGPGGTFVGTSWGTTGTDRSYAAALSVYRRYTGNVPRPFSALLDEKTWSDPERGRACLARSGLSATRVVTRRLEGRYPTAAAALEWALSWPLTAAGVERLEPARREALRADALAAIEAENDLHWERAVHYYQAVATGSGG
jgi:SAM-dependent methyltransferase